MLFSVVADRLVCVNLISGFHAVQRCSSATELVVLGPQLEHHGLHLHDPIDGSIICLCLTGNPFGRSSKPHELVSIGGTRRMESPQRVNAPGIRRPDFDGPPSIPRR